MSAALRAIILDFDGTLVESVGIKDEAFAALYDGEAQFETIMAYHRAHNHVVRFDKFRHIAKEILKRPYTQADAQNYARRFRKHVYQAIVACPEVPGATHFLESFSTRCDLFLVSMTPDEELLEILAGRNMSGFFSGIFGASWKKTEALEAIMSERHLVANQVVFIGDTPEDCACAQSAGMPFIWRDSGMERAGSTDPVFPDMASIADFLSNQYERS